MTSTGGGWTWAAAGGPLRQIAPSAPIDREAASARDRVPMLRFMSPSLCGMLVVQALAEMLGELGPLLGSEQRGHDLVEAHGTRRPVLRDVRVGRVRGGERLRVEGVGHEGRLEGLEVRIEGGGVRLRRGVLLQRRGDLLDLLGREAQLLGERREVARLVLAAVLLVQADLPPDL